MQTLRTILLKAKIAAMCNKGLRDKNGVIHMLSCYQIFRERSLGVTIRIIVR